MSDAARAETLTETMGRLITDPRCEECGTSVTPDNPLLGPHLCPTCDKVRDIEFRARVREFSHQQRLGQRVHVVCLPADLPRPQFGPPAPRGGSTS